MSRQETGDILQESLEFWERERGEWSKKNNYFHINVLKLLALKFAILLSKRICQT